MSKNVTRRQFDPIAQLKEELERESPIVARIVYEVLAPQAFDAFTTYNLSKHVNDPVWRLVELDPWEVSALDLPLMQRLRRVRQLGLAHLVYPSAQHTRFEHSIGALAAAAQMFDALARRSALAPGPELERIRKCIRLAALLHDCGHGAFSHVSERVLAGRTFLGPQFKKAKGVLDALFAHAKKETTTDVSPEAPPPAAELLSALLLLTPQMTDFLSSHSCGLDVQDQLRMVAMVLGRPYQLVLSTGGKQVSLDFAKGLISGDIDADKLDYVARDAYFSGIPIAADVYRLINQLDVISVIKGDEGGRGGCKDSMVLAVQSTGIATVEMFIFTRAYLFDRIYQHPKIRAAESSLERELQQLTTNSDLDKSAAEFVSLIYHSGGDDYCIGKFADRSVASGTTLSLANRMLPRRVLAVAPRFAIGYAAVRRDWSAMLRKAWVRTIAEAPANLSELEKMILLTAGIPVGEGTVIMDMPRKSALKGLPELYVRRGQATVNGIPEEIGRHFDAAQFSAAYENVKKTIWIFSDYSKPARVAAAAALTFMIKFGLVPSDDGLIAAKIDPDDFSRALDDIEAEAPVLAPLVAELRRARANTLTLPTEMLASSLKFGDRSENLTAATLLASALNKSGLTKESLDDLDGALLAVRWIIEHSETSAQVTGKHKLSMKESDFRGEVETFLRTHASEEIDPERESENSIGRADFALRLFAGRLQIALELKVESRPFDDIVADRLEQPFHYAADPKFGRVSILYVRFRDNRPRRPVEDFAVHTVNKVRAPMLVICIGQKTTSAPASKLAGNLPRTDGLVAQTKHKRPRSKGR